MLGNACTFDLEVISQPPRYGKNSLITNLSNLQAMPLRYREGKELLFEPCVSLCGHFFIPQTYLSTWEPHWGERDTHWV